MRSGKPGSGLQSAAALLLLAVFAVCAVKLLVSGAGIYSGIADRDRSVLDLRTAEEYVLARIRSCDETGAVRILDASLSPAGTGPVLELREAYGDRAFHTLLYYSEGRLMELFCPEDAGLSLSDGDPVLEIGGISFAADGDAIRIVLEAGGRTRTFVCMPRAGQEGGVPR